jgi:membrane protein DedA with SNARE-associated domain
LILGQLIGATVIYILSLGLGNTFSKWLCNKAPRLERKLIQLEGKLDEHAVSALLFLRLGPGINTAASMASGLANIEYRKFALGVVISVLITDGARFFAGFAAFQGITILGIQPQTWQIVTGVILLLALFGLSTYRIKVWADRRYPKAHAVVHSAGFSNRTCPLPPEKVKISKT